MFFDFFELRFIESVFNIMDDQINVKHFFEFKFNKISNDISKIKKT